MSNPPGCHCWVSFNLNHSIWCSKSFFGRTSLAELRESLEEETTLAEVKLPLRPSRFRIHSGSLNFQTNRLSRRSMLMNCINPHSISLGLYSQLLLNFKNRQLSPIIRSCTRHLLPSQPRSSFESLSSWESQLEYLKSELMKALLSNRRLTRLDRLRWREGQLPITSSLSTFDMWGASRCVKYDEEPISTLIQWNALHHSLRTWTELSQWIRVFRHFGSTSSFRWMPLKVDMLDHANFDQATWLN